MKKYQVLIPALLLNLLALDVLFGQDYSVSSPNGSNKIEVFIEEAITYQVSHKDQLILDKSPISITLDGKKLGQNPSIKNDKTRSVDQTIKPVVKVKRAEIRDNYNELELIFSGKYGVIFRAYNEGVAYRITTSLKGELPVDQEEVVFNFTADHSASFPMADGFYTHYERNYTGKTINNLSSEEMSCLPVLLHLDNGVKVVITEADLYNYPGFYLKKGSAANSLEGTFPYYPKSYDQKSDRDVVPIEREDYLAKVLGTRKFPWRLMVISDEDKELIETELVFQLSTELQLEDVSWIRPGKVAWDWYNANNIFGVEFESGINTDTYKYYIDFASKYGLEYIILDEGWYDITTNDLLHPVPDINMTELVAYGAEKNVSLILWVTWKALEDQFTQALNQFQDWDIKGIKVDFMQRDDQWMVEYYERVAKATAERKMLVDFHGSYKPSGLRRAYPNVISREGLKGLEQHKWEGQFANPENDLEILFIRMLAGPIDYTPGAMENAQKHNYQPIFQRPMSLGTRCHQLAMYVAFESPLQMLADSPSKYLKEPECMEFLSVVPSIWDDTKVLDAKYGDYAVIARRNGNDWYVGAMTDWEKRDLEVDFSFLGEGDYTVDLYQDGINAERYGADYKKVTRTIRSTDKLNIHLASGGGWAARIYKP